MCRKAIHCFWLFLMTKERPPEVDLCFNGGRTADGELTVSVCWTAVSVYWMAIGV